MITNTYNIGKSHTHSQEGGTASPPSGPHGPFCCFLITLVSKAVVPEPYVSAPPPLMQRNAQLPNPLTIFFHVCKERSTAYLASSCLFVFPLVRGVLHCFSSFFLSSDLLFHLCMECFHGFSGLIFYSFLHHII